MKINLLNFNNILKASLVLLTGLICSISFGQSTTITGQLLQDKKPVTDAHILFIDNSTQETIDYIMPNNEGKYTVNLPINKNTKALSIQCQGVLYNSSTRLLTLAPKQTTYQVNFNLTLKENSLEEIIVISEREKLSVKNDTVVYYVDTFKSIEDKKIIDVLSKMPGIDVEKKTGEIKYKGKTIETILLDGDNLLGKQYSIGAKSISTDLIEKVEAIEDYHESRLTKGIKKSNKVALNLELKKGISKFNGEIGAGIGNESHLGLLDGVLLSKKQKALLSANANNISLNNTPFYAETYQSENLYEVENYATNPLNFINAPTNFQRSYENNLHFGAINHLINFSKSAQFKTNLSYFNDKQHTQTNVFRSFSINNQNFESSDSLANSYNPSYFVLGNEVNFNKKNTSIQYQNRFVIHKNTYTDKRVQNLNNRFKTNSKRNQNYSQHIVKLKNKIDTLSIIELDVNFAQDKQRQNLNINGNSILINGLSYNNQNLIANKNHFSSLLAFTKRKKQLVYNVGIKANFNNETMNYQTAQTDDYKYETANFSIKPKISYQSNNKKINSSIDLELHQFDQNITSYSLNKKDLFVNTNASFFYKFNQKNSANIGFSNAKTTNNAHFLHKIPFLIDTRTLVYNKPSLNLTSSIEANTGYSYYNLYKELGFSLNINYSANDNAYFSNQQIDENISFVEFFQTPRHIHSLGINQSANILISKLSQVIELKTFANSSKNYSFLNNSIFQQTNSSIFKPTLNLKSGFEGLFNYNVGINYTLNNSKLENQTKIQNKFFEGNIGFRFKPMKDLILNINTETLLHSNTSFSTNQLFTDVDFTYYKTKMNYFIIARNLFNKDNFQQIDSNEFSTTIFSRNLFPSFIAVGGSYTF